MVSGRLLVSGGCAAIEFGGQVVATGFSGKSREEREYGGIAVIFGPGRFA
ncbi:hypothetical protein [Fimbriiglobus ruber]|nr:hypothetical protein [Fimbriiglobus ruber]